MLSNTASKLPPVALGDNVRVPIPNVDRGKLGPTHILGVITEVSNNSYRIGTNKGTLDRKYSRGEFQHWTDSCYLTVQDIPPVEIKMYTISNLLSHGGKIICQCRGNCVTEYCPCKVRGYYCSSGCHLKSNANCKNSGDKNTLLEPRKLKSKLITSPFHKKSPKKSHFSPKPFDDDADINIAQKEMQSYSSKSQSSEVSDLALSFSQLEPLCVEWGGNYIQTKLVNTCPINNFITLISLHINPIRSALRYLPTKANSALSDFLTNIQQRNFDSLRYWLSKKLDIRQKNCTIDFFGSEYTMVKHLYNIGLNCMKYEQKR